MYCVPKHWQYLILVSLSLSSTFLQANAQRSGDLRLAGYGASRLAGRLEIYLNEEWGTVCTPPHDSLYITKVACRQLGLGHFVGHVPGAPLLRYGLGDRAIWLEDLRCRADDLHLLRCDRPEPITTATSSCDHHMDLSVMCSGVVTPYEGEVRLMGGAYSSEGVAQIYLHHNWSTLCSTGMEPGLAVSICRQVGYTRALSIQQSSNVTTGQFWHLPSSTQCSVSSYPCLKSCLSDFSSVSSSSSSSCSEDGLSAWRLTCGILESEFGNSTSGSAKDCTIQSPQAEEYEVRLHGDLPDQGRVEVYVGGEWTSVQELRDEEATVVCKQLGFPNSFHSLTTSDSSLSSLDMSPIPDSQITLSCTGLETHIRDCRFTSPETTDHSTDAYISCSPIIWPFGSLQLVGGAGSFGQLLVSPHIDFQWLCDAHFSMAEAEVACRQMGYSNAIRVVRNSLLSDYPNASLLHYSLYCSGAEEYLMACQRRSLVSEYCRDNLDFVAIQCGSSSFNGGWRVRLVPVATDNDGIHSNGGHGNITESVREGRVEVQLEEEGKWGGVCVEDFSELSAHVVCRQLGFETYSSVSVVESDPENGAGGLLTSVQCTGFEDLLDYCPHSLATTNCSHVISVNCSGILPSPDGQLRIVNTSSTTAPPQPSPSSSSSSSVEGRLEVSYHGMWMSVCGRLLSQEAADVACRQLGFGTPANYCTNACYGQGAGYIHFGEYSCHGNESRILDCGVNIHNTEYCSHGDDVGLACSPMQSVEVVAVPSSTAASSSSISLPLPSLSPSLSASHSYKPTVTDKVPRNSLTPSKDNPFISDGIIYVLAVVLCLLLLSLIFSVTLCCVVRKKRDSWVPQAPNGSYSDRNVAAIGEGTDTNGGVSLREVVETEGETPDFDFDAVADDVGMKACAKEAEAMTISPSHTSLTSSSGLPPQYHELEFLSHLIPGEETKDLN